MHFNMLSAKRQPFCFGLDMLRQLFIYVLVNRYQSITSNRKVYTILP